jgi:hypothetical protein
MTYTISDFRRDIRHPYAWPGGYPCYFVMADGEALSFKAAKAERRLILEAIRDQKDYPDKQWLPVGVEINWEDPALFCSHTNERIESAYTEDQANG